MLTDKELPPAPRFKTSRWLLSGLMFWSLFFGAMGALAVLMLVDKSKFNIGDDPAPQYRELVGENETAEEIQKIEPAAAAQEPASEKTNPDDITAIKQGMQQALAETATLKEQLLAIQKDANQDNTMARVLAGLTQLKAAYESDRPLASSIKALRSTISDPDIEKTLSQLEGATQDLPSKDKILAQLGTMGAPEQNKETPAENAEPLTIKERAALAFGKLVSVRPSNEVSKGTTLERIQQAVAYDHYSEALSLTKELPETTTTQSLANDLQQRITTKNLIQKATFQISRALGNSAKGLY